MQFKTPKLFPLYSHYLAIILKKTYARNKQYISLMISREINFAFGISNMINFLDNVCRLAMKTGNHI